MLTAIVFGLAASSALVIGAAIGARVDPAEYVTAILLAFASGALISALSFELFQESFELGGATRAGLGLLAGAAVFVIADTALDRKTTGASTPRAGGAAQAAGGRAVGWALLAGVTLDGVPENLALGVSLADETSLALLLAIFFSNLPEALVGAVAMRGGGQSPGNVMTIWVGCGLLLAAAVVGGFAVGDTLGDPVLSVALGFAGGAVLASLADTLMPEAFRHGGPWIAFATSTGFFAAFVLAV